MYIPISLIFWSLKNTLWWGTPTTQVLVKKIPILIYQVARKDKEGSFWPHSGIALIYVIFGHILAQNDPGSILCNLPSHWKYWLPLYILQIRSKFYPNIASHAILAYCADARVCVHSETRNDEKSPIGTPRKIAGGPSTKNDHPSKWLLHRRRWLI